jgi:hypothetical protein
VLPTSYNVYSSYNRIFTQPIDVHYKSDNIMFIIFAERGADDKYDEVGAPTVAHTSVIRKVLLAGSLCWG